VYGQLLLCLRRPREAEQIAREAIARGEELVTDYPHFRWGRECLARANGVLNAALLGLNRDTDAEEAARAATEQCAALVELLSESIKYATNLACAHYRLGECLWRSGWCDEATNEFSEARCLLERLVDQNPDSPQRARPLSILLTLCPVADTRAPARGLELALIALQPEIGATWQLLGAAYYRASRWQEAVDALTTSVETRQGGDANDYLLLAMAHWQLDNQAEATNWYERAGAAIDGKRPLSLQNCAHAFYLRELVEEADKLMGTTQSE
jgi:tetratricopeptide (TPR) repeat protein